MSQNFQNQEQIVHNKIVLNIQKRKQKNRMFNYLKLRNHKTPIIPERSKLMIQRLTHIRILNFSQCGLISLRNLPSLPLLSKLDLTMNKIEDSEIIFLLNCKNIRLLYLTQNLIQRWNSLSLLSEMPRLKQIDLSSNPCTYIISDIFGILPQLSIVDRYTTGGADLQDFEADDPYESESNSISQMSEESQISFTQKEMQGCKNMRNSMMQQQISEPEIENIQADLVLDYLYS